VGLGNKVRAMTRKYLVDEVKYHQHLSESELSRIKFCLRYDEFGRLHLLGPFSLKYLIHNNSSIEGRSIVLE
jgi:hypothetical protein